jgi:hypothetical protein
LGKLPPYSGDLKPVSLLGINCGCFRLPAAFVRQLAVLRRHVVWHILSLSEIILHVAKAKRRDAHRKNRVVVVTERLDALQMLDESLDYL